MALEKIFQEILENFGAVIEQSSSDGKRLWKELIDIHPADIAQFCSSLGIDEFRRLFREFQRPLKAAVFNLLPHPTQVSCLSFLDEDEKAFVLSSMPIDEIVALFDCLSDDDLKKYLNLLHKNDRKKVVSMMQFESDSAGSIMDMDVLTLTKHFTVDKCVHILQRFRPKEELHHQIYVTDRANKLVGVPFVWISNPLTIPVIYGPNYLIGRWLLGGKTKAPNFLDAISWTGGPIEKIHAWWQATWGVFWPLWIGSILMGLVLGTATYFATRYAVVTYRRRRERRIRRRRERRGGKGRRDRSPA